MQSVSLEAFNRSQNNVLEQATNTEISILAKLLPHSGANHDARDSKQQTPLHEATMREGAGMLTLLLLKGTNPNCMNSDGNTPLQVAIQKRRDFVALILQQFCPVA